MQQDTSPTQPGFTVQTAAIKANDEAALRQLYVQNFPKLRYYVLQNGGSEEEAKDVYQEAFLAVWRNVQLDKFRPEGEDSLPGYLYRIGKNKWLDHLRSAHYKKVVALPENNDHIADEPASDSDAEYIAAVKKHLVKLGDRCQQVLRMFYYERLSLRQIATAFSWTEATAKNNKYRCIEQLRNLITPKTEHRGE